MKRKLVTVYGSLLEGFGNWNWCLNNEGCVKLGSHVLEGPFVMLSLGGFPGLIVDHSKESKLYVETYDVPEEVYQRIERLEGFRYQDSPDNFYNKKPIETPFGDSEIYVLNEDARKSYLNAVPENSEGVISWKEYRLHSKF